MKATRVKEDAIKKSNLLGLGILLGGVDEQVADTARVAPLVVVPGDELDKVRVQADTGRSIKDRRVSLADEIRRHDVVLGIADDALRFQG